MANVKGIADAFIKGYGKPLYKNDREKLMKTWGDIVGECVAQELTKQMNDGTQSQTTVLNILKNLISNAETDAEKINGESLLNLLKLNKNKWGRP